MPAERLAGDAAFAEPTRAWATDDQAPDENDALEAFLEDEAAVERLRESARCEAERRIEEWNLGGR